MPKICYTEHRFSADRIRKPGPKPLRITAVVRRFWSRVVKQRGGCWLWIGHRLFKYGRLWYGMFQARGLSNTPIYAHRFAWGLYHKRPVPDGLDVLHHCDEPGCVRRSHLFLGTQTDNNMDMIKKGRLKIGGDYRRFLKSA